MTQQLITEPTRVTDKTSSLLDVILTSDHSSHVKSGVLKTYISDHFLTYTLIDTDSNFAPQDHTEITFRDYRKFDENAFSSDLQLEFDAPVTDWDTFKAKFDMVCDKHAPIATRRVRSDAKPWIDSDMTEKYLERDYAHAKFIETKDESWKAKRDDLKIECRNHRWATPRLFQFNSS